MSSVTRLDYFWKILATKFISKVAQIVVDFLGQLEKCHFFCGNFRTKLAIFLFQHLVTLLMSFAFFLGLIIKYSTQLEKFETYGEGEYTRGSLRLQMSIYHVTESLPVWPDWAIFCTLANISKPLATINLPKSLTFLGKFCKGVKIYHSSNEIIFGQLL